MSLVNAAPPAPAPAPVTTGLLAANLVCMASMLFWAAGLPAANHLILLMPYADLNLLRMALAALALLPVWWLVEGHGALARADWGRGLAVGGLIALAGWLLLAGQARGGAALAAVIATTLPVVGLGLEVVLDGRRITRAVALGLGLTLAGAALTLNGTGPGDARVLGALVTFVSVIVFAVASRLSVTALPRETPLGRSALTIAGAALGAALIAALAHAGGTPLPGFAHWGWAETATLALYALVAMAFSQILWIISVERLGIGMSSLHVNAAPFYVMLILFALGNPWSWRDAAAAALVALGVLVAQGLLMRRRATARPGP